MNLTLEQQIAYDAIGNSTSLFITGGAGTGKSLVIVSKMQNDTDGDFVLCATTNKAAKLLEEKLNTGEKVNTLHSILGLAPINDGSTKDGDEILSFQIPSRPDLETSLAGKNLIIDESSMICGDVQNYILKLLEFNNLQSVTFVGDRYQLPCVKGHEFKYELIENIIELKEVKRAQGDLVSYYNQIRNEVIEKNEISFYDDGKYFNDEIEFVEYLKNQDGTKVIVTYTNDSAAKFAGLIDGNIVEENKECNALSHCNYKHIELSKFMSVDSNSAIKILKVFLDYAQMKRDSFRNNYEYELPLEPIGITLNNIFYVKITNSQNIIGYISVWNGAPNTKQTIFLNHFTREYRKFQDGIKRTVNSSIWNRFAKADGYLKSLGQLRGYVKFPNYIWNQDRIFWNNFTCVADAVIIRSSLVSTAHRAQGMTVDNVGIVWDDLMRSKDSKLIYVALTRASKQIIFLKN